GLPMDDGSCCRLGTTSIANYLDELHIPTPSGAPYWSKATIRDMLKNPTYAGLARWGYRKVHKIRHADGSITEHRHDTESCLLVPGKWPKIISAETYKLAEDIRLRNRRMPAKLIPRTDGGSPVLQNPLAGLCYCAKCGSRMTRLGPNSHNPYDSLKCSGKNCDNISAPVYLVEEKLLDFLASWLEQYRLQHKDYVPVDDDRPVLKSSITNIKREVDTARKQLDSTYDLLERGVYNVEVFTQRNTAISETIADLEKKLQELEKKYEATNKVIQLRHDFIPLVENVLEAYGRIETAAGKNDLLRTVVDRIEYRKDEPNRKGKRDNANFELKVWPKIPK
ncbi:MAG: recombinase family protein, partial [Lachnospiraceae bacterium]|nr:recombinase family protein [Lachnospiraceae bacterium]